MTTGRTRIAILGSTGSIGRQAIEIASRSSDRIEVVALAANSNARLLAAQARATGAKAVALAAPPAPLDVDLPVGTTLSTGPEAVAELACTPGVDVVLNALVGAAGLRASLAALDSGARLALANKESLVIGGSLVTQRAREGQLIPVDSEHSAIFQCLVGEDDRRVERLWLTASGGPFRGMSRDQLDHVTVEQALHHPRWSMGPKITIDSATLMNKGLEVIEAHHLFRTPYERISVVIHPESIVHSMVEFSDGSVKAHLGVTDMRVPIQYALSYPDRWEAPLEPLDLTTLGALHFDAPDLETFRCLTLAIEAGRTGGTMPAAMNAANEVAVAAFLDGTLPYLGIERIVDAVMVKHDIETLESIEQVEAVDAWARRTATSLLGA